MDNSKLKVLCGELQGLVSRIASAIDEGGSKELTKDEYLAKPQEERDAYDKDQVMSKGKKDEEESEEIEK